MFERILSRSTRIFVDKFDVQDEHIEFIKPSRKTQGWEFNSVIIIHRV